MMALKFIILAIAILCSLWIACWLIISIAQYVVGAKYNKPTKTSINFLWFIVAALAWSALIVFF